MSGGMISGGTRKLLGYPLAVAARAAAGLSARIGTGTERVNSIKLRYFDYRPRDSDVFLITYPRSGTTWLQMMLYQLTTDGDMDFVHIADRLPWFERIPYSGKDIETLPDPRIFKSHLSYADVPKGRFRYVYCCRDGGDVAVSYYHFRRSHGRYDGDFATFFDLFMRGKVPYGSWVDHVAGWWARRHDPNVLFLRYEDAVADLPEFLRVIADFCGIEIEEESVGRILNRCSFEFMKRHEARFDPAMESLWETGLTPDVSFRHGPSGDRRMWLTPEQEERLEDAIKNRIGVTLAGLTDRKRARPGSSGMPGDVEEAC